MNPRTKADLIREWWFDPLMIAAIQEGSATARGRDVLERIEDGRLTPGTAQSVPYRAMVLQNMSPFEQSQLSLRAGRLAQELER